MWNFNPKLKNVDQRWVIMHLPRDIVEKGRAKPIDYFYKLPLNPKYIMNKIKSYKYKYIIDERDCDDFVYIFKGILSQIGYGNILAMNTNVTINTDEHNLISFIDINNNIDEWGKYKLIFGEPQTGLLIDKKISDTFTNIRIRI